jgi:hypothetical protein
MTSVLGCQIGDWAVSSCILPSPPWEKKCRMEFNFAKRTIRMKTLQEACQNVQGIDL